MADWRNDVACRDADPELFFPAEDEPVTALAASQVAAARAVCGACPVRAKCLAWALAAGQDFGVWGGLTPEQRRAVRRGDRSRTSDECQPPFGMTTGGG